MSLYGAMMIGVSALDAFSNALSTSSSNIANVNTIGYKSAQSAFSTLVASSMGEGDPSSVGVISGASQNIAQQGLLSTASSPTDLAISGNGFFVVSDSSGQGGGTYYTRAGDFNPDANGFLRNSSGYYLRGYGVDAQGNVAPGTALSAINISNLTGKAEPTTTMTLQANLQASTDVYSGTYNPGDMTNGSPPVEPSFTRTMNVYDSQGGSQPITIDWLKTGANQWSYEVSYAGDAANLSSSSPLLATGTVNFNPDGTLAGLTSTDGSSTTSGGSLSLNIPWGASSGLNAQPLTLDFGTVGASNGLSQFDSASTLTNSTVDGALFGTLSGVTVGADGMVTAQFSNGLTQKIAQVPLATFTNANGLSEVSGNAFAQSLQSGNAVIGAAGAGGAGSIQSNALEGSTVDLATEFTNLITTQRAYSASTRVITTASEMLDTLNNMH
jgi:flagellar hook protein FlgE